MRTIGVPFIHGYTHRASKSADPYDVRVVGTYKMKLTRLPKMIERIRRERTNQKYGPCKDHKSQVFPCRKNSVYQIGLTCGKVYIGETSKCPNTRLEEHTSHTAKYSSFTEHWNTCGCSIDATGSKLLADKGLQGAYPRKIVETLCIEDARNSSAQVISNPSVIPTQGERNWLNRFPPSCLHKEREASSTA